MSRHVLGTNLAEVGLLRAAPRIGVTQSKRRSLALVDLFTAAITHEHCFSGHEILLLNWNITFIVAKKTS